jgi:hypothetical protein
MIFLASRLISDGHLGDLSAKTWTPDWKALMPTVRPPRLATLVLMSAAAVVLALTTACTSGPAEFRILITEPSGNASTSQGQLYGHWSCDPTVDPATRYQGAQDAKWTSVEGVAGQSMLQTSASCPAGALLTVQVDAGIAERGYNKTRLRCEVFDGDGDRLADESVTRDLGTSDPICRVAVPG